MPTTARGIWTPSDTDAVDFTTDLATMAGTIDNALSLYGNALRGTASQRAAFLSAAAPGMLWQDTDSIGMLWKRGPSTWVPAVWRWVGTTTQMASFAAPDGFKWFSTTNSSEYVRFGGAWVFAAPSGSITSVSSITVTTGNTAPNPAIANSSLRGVTRSFFGFTVPFAGNYAFSFSFQTGTGGSAQVYGEVFTNSPSGTKWGGGMASQTSTSDRNMLVMSGIANLAQGDSLIPYLTGSTNLTMGSFHTGSIHYVG